MTLYSLFNSFSPGGFVSVIVIILSLIEITPVKISPLSLIGKKVNKYTNDEIKELTKEVNHLKVELTEVKREISDEEMRTSRYRIIRFDDERNHGMAHSVDHADQILEDCDIYKKYCSEHKDFQNHKGQGAMLRLEQASIDGTLTQGLKQMI